MAEHSQHHRLQRTGEPHHVIQFYSPQRECSACHPHHHLKKTTPAQHRKASLTQHPQVSNPVTCHWTSSQTEPSQSRLMFTPPPLWCGTSEPPQGNVLSFILNTNNNPRHEVCGPHHHHHQTLLSYQEDITSFAEGCTNTILPPAKPGS